MILLGASLNLTLIASLDTLSFHLMILLGATLNFPLVASLDILPFHLMVSLGHILFSFSPYGLALSYSPFLSPNGLAGTIPPLSFNLLVPLGPILLLLLHLMVLLDTTPFHLS